VPILVLTARGGIGDRVTGLDAGADDYLAKPFAVEELLARLRALSRRPPTSLDVTLKVADLELDLSTRVARRAGVPLRLTAREQALLECFLRNPGRVLSRTRILDKVWDDGFDPVGNVVDVLVSRLRRRIDLPGTAPLIHTVRGLGYVLAETPPDGR
jgi:Response regulators consisting of a CheY-like receiver domain and a winged-helix DNA-binding domain